MHVPMPSSCCREMSNQNPAAVMGCKRQEKWHSHLIPLEISDVFQSQRKTAPTAEREDENRRLNVTPRAEPRRCCALLIAARRHSGSALFCGMLMSYGSLTRACVPACACVFVSTPTCNRTKPERSIRPLPGCACTSPQFSNLFVLYIPPPFHHFKHFRG